MAGKVNRLSPFNITVLALGMAFLYLPIVILVIYSFNDSRLVTVWGGWSLRWYREFFNDSAMLDAAWMSLRVAAISATIATLLFVPVVFALLHRKAASTPHLLQETPEPGVQPKPESEPVLA